ncbi:MAG: hypothetical protein WCX16_05580 [Candidatus Omnitrophota bacterium]
MNNFLLKNKWWITVVVLCVAVGFGIDLFVKQAVTVGASQVVGAPVHVDYLDIGIVRPSINIKGFKIYNPKGFPQGVLLDLQQIRVNYHPLRLLKGQLHASLVIVDLNEMVIIKNKDGKLNVDALKVAEEKKDEKKASEQKPAQSVKMQMDVVKLNIDHVVYKDFSQSEQGQILVYDVNLKDKIFKDIASPQQLVTLIMVQAIGPTAVKSAAVYGAATVLGVAFLPAGVAGILIGKDDVVKEWSRSKDKIYGVSLDVIKKIGKFKNEDKSKGIINGLVYGADVQIVIKKGAKGKTQVAVSARKTMLPKPEIAAGVLYQIQERLR